MMNSNAQADSSNRSFDRAIKVLDQATTDGPIRGAVLFARIEEQVITQAFGTAKSPDSIFLLGSISKPIVVAALMTLYEKGLFELDTPVHRYLPEFRGGDRDRVTVRHLLTHVSGLPDQLPNNAELRSQHEPLAKFVEGALGVPLLFEPGTRYEYSSMAILLAAEIAQRLSGTEIREFVDRAVFQPLGMTRSALGNGKLPPAMIMDCQVEYGAVESGGGAEESKSWDWNSSYWRALGAPWGGVQASAGDVAKFLESFLQPTGKLFRPLIAQTMLQNQNRSGFPPRGLGFDLGLHSHCSGCSPQTFGHTGSTGTIAWADPIRHRVCVVLTTLPGQALADHPRHQASEAIAT